MFKKILVIIPVLAVIIAAAVQGTQKQYAVGAEGQRIVLATDVSVVNDQSFNQDSFLGLTRFMEDNYGLGEGAKKYNYVEGSEHGMIGIINNYKAALLKGADALVLPGFPHREPLENSASNFLSDKSIILLDEEVHKPNIISIIFNAQFAGLQAGFDASVWATRPTGRTLPNGRPQLQGDLNNDGEIRIGTFGGFSGKNSVDGYLFGLFLGMELFNQTVGVDEGVSVGYANTRSGSIDDLGPISGGDPTYFTGTFSLGDAIRKGTLATLVDANGADIIFPVAGLQINDVIGYEAKRTSTTSGYYPYIIGVDADQTLAHPTAADQGRILSSAIKNLNAAVYASLGHARTLRQKTDENGNLGALNGDVLPKDQIWDGTKPKAERNWSESTIGGKNKIQQHAFKLFNEGNGEGPLIPGQDYDDVLIKILDLYSNPDLKNPEDYLKGSFIKTVVAAILADVKSNGMIDQEAIKQMNLNLTEEKGK